MGWAEAFSAKVTPADAQPMQLAQNALGARLTPATATAIARAESRTEGLRPPADEPGVPTPMTRSFDLSRRSALLAASGLGLSVSFLGRQAFAASEGAVARRKLVVFICRGGMDGLSVSPPIGDPNYAGLRGEIAIAGFGQPNGALKLDETFGLHPRLDDRPRPGAQGPGADRPGDRHPGPRALALRGAGRAGDRGA